MSSLFAIYRKKNHIDHISILNDALNKINTWAADFTRVSTMENVGMGCHLLYSSPQTKNEELSDQHEIGNYSIISISRLDYRLDLAKKLEIHSKKLPIYSDSKLILLAYCKWGDKCVEHLFGDFAFIIWDKYEERMFCARDHFGLRPLYYIDEVDYFAISSDIRTFTVLPGFSMQLDEQYVVDALSSIYPNKRTTGFKNIYRIEPAHILVLSQTNPIEYSQYWDLQSHEQFSKLSESEAIIGLRERFIESVKQRTASLNSVGTELSGGLDSSSIYSCLVNEIRINEDVYTFSHTKQKYAHSGQLEIDNEQRYVKILIESLKEGQHFFITGEDSKGGISAISSSLEVLMKPIFQGFSVMSNQLYRKVNLSGVKVLLSGFGGDEGVTNSGSGIFEEIVEKRNIKKIRYLIRRGDRRALLRYVRLIVKYYIMLIAPWVIQIINNVRRVSPNNYFAIDHELIRKYSIRKRFKNQVFVAKVPNVKHRQHSRLMHPYLVDRIENSYFNAQQKRIEYRYPFLDVKLLEFYYSVKSDYKYKNGIGRYIFRESMKGILIDKIRLRNDKSGAPIPYIKNLFIQDESKIRELISDSRTNNQFHYIDYDKLSLMLDQLLHDKRRYKRYGFRSVSSSISVLILQKWQRDGKLDIGIKC